MTEARSWLRLPPVFTTEKALDRSLYLPAGCWMGYNDKRTVYDGKVTILVAATLGVVPLFVARGGNHSPRGHREAKQQLGRKLGVSAAHRSFPSVKQESQFTYFMGRAVKVIKASPGGNNLAIEFEAWE